MLGVKHLLSHCRALIFEDLKITDTAGFEDRGGLIIHDGSPGVGAVSFGLPIPILGQADQAIPDIDRFVQLMGDDDERVIG